MLGAYIDSLPADARDRIITAPNWTSGALTWLGDRCLVGHAEDWGTIAPRAADLCAARVASGFRPTIRFDALVERFGLDRVVRACKLRAAHGNAPALADAPLAAASTA